MMERRYQFRWATVVGLALVASLSAAAPNRLHPVGESYRSGFAQPLLSARQDSGIVKEIIIKGNVRQSKEGILATMRTKVGRPLNQTTLAEDRETLFDLGVFKVEPNITTTANPDGSYSVTVEVVENPVIKEIRVVGNTVVSQADILKVVTLKAGDIYSARAASATSHAIEDQYTKRGYFAKVVDISYLNDSPQTLNIQIQEQTVSSVTITGNTRTKKRVLDHLIKTRPGEPFNINKWRKDYRRVVDTGWFEPVTPKDDSTSIPGQIGLGLDVREAHTGNFGVGLQVDPQSSFAGFIKYTESNWKGTGQSLGASYSEGTLGGGPSVDLSYGNPFIDNKDTYFRVSLFSHLIYRFTNSVFGGSSFNGSSQYIERRTGTAIGFSRPINDEVSASISTRVEGVKTSNTDPTNGNGFIQQDGYIVSTTLGYTKDRRDVAIDSSRGDYMTLSAEPGYSDITSVGGLIANQSYIGWSGFTKFGAEYRRYLTKQPPRKELDEPRRVLALRVRGGIIAGKIPFFEQYFAGGIDSVRGYDQDRYWGTRTFLTTIEYRLPIQKAFSFITFVDYGGAWGGYSGVNNFIQPAGINLHIGYGIGIAFKSPLGIIRLDLGVNEDRSTRTTFQIGPSF